MKLRWKTKAEFIRDRNIKWFDDIYLPIFKACWLAEGFKLELCYNGLVTEECNRCGILEENQKFISTSPNTGNRFIYIFCENCIKKLEYFLNIESKEVIE